MLDFLKFSLNRPVLKVEEERGRSEGSFGPSRFVVTLRPAAQVGSPVRARNLPVRQLPPGHSEPVPSALTDSLSIQNRLG